VAASAVVVSLLVRFTVWGRQFWRIALPYFRPDRRWKSWRPLITVLVMLWMTVLAVRRGDRLRQMPWLSARFELGEAATRTGPYNVDTAGGLWS
jgi:hypothetical protein